MCLGAGDETYHFAIARDTHRQVIADRVSDVKEVAQLYATNFVAVRRKRAEQKYLAPLNLDYETFISKQRSLSPRSVATLQSRLLDHVLGVQAIIAGVDSTGPHIYTVATEPGEIPCEVCHDGMAFVAIGTGHRQFATLLMSLGYTKECGSLRALFLMFSAKKRSEVSPGVGTATDAAFISTGEDAFAFGPEAIKALAQYHDDFTKKVDLARNDVLDKMASDPIFGDDNESPQESLPEAPAPPKPPTGS